ncbi:MAG TPA: MFS transporter [Candidatus Baltobacteraceae bacterium]|nr:MFS transporter [Candidatus Baltobacteraceae bacterium]
MKHVVRASERYHWYALAVIMLGSMMGTLDASIANVAMPTIAHAYASTVDNAEWVLLAFMLVTASTLVLFGRLGDMFGQKRIYLGGFAIFGLSSLACAFAPSLLLLILARAVQAIGAAMLVSSNQAMIVDTFPASDRGRAIGLNGAAVAIGLSLGPIVGGAIVTYWHWQWIFLINVPISLVAMIAAAFVLRPVRHEGRGFDALGATLSIVGLFCLSLALSRIHIWDWKETAALAAASLVILGIFVVVERRVAAPTLDLSLFTNRLFAFSVAAAFVYFVAISGLIFIVPLAAQLALGYSPFAAGLLLMPITALNVVLAPLAGSLSDRVAVRYVSTAGAVIVAIGLFVMSRLPALPNLWQLVGAMMIAGFGTAVFSQPNNSAIMGTAPPHRRGIAAGTLATARTTGQLLGVATAGAVYFLFAARYGASTFAPASTYFGITSVVMIVVAAISWVRE